MIFLKNLYQWLEVWDKLKAKEGKLTRETFTALRHTTHGIIEVTTYCIQGIKMKYIVTDKFQTDKLESRFGQYRQLKVETITFQLDKFMNVRRNLGLCLFEINHRLLITREFF